MRRCLTTVLLAVACWAGGVAGIAQVQAPQAPTAPLPRPEAGAPVVLNGRVLFRLKGPNAEERAQQIGSRLRTLVTREAPVTDTSVSRRGDDYVISVGEIPVMTITPADAQAQRLAPEALAQDWAGLMLQAVQDARAERASWVRRVLNPVVRSFQQLATSALEAAPRVLASLIILLITLYVARLLRAAVRFAVRRRPIDPNLQQLVRSLAFYGTWVVGFLLIASVMGIDTASLVTALGLGAFALGFALKDILAHFVAGVVILAGRTFQIGDQIAVHGYEGTVERIELRATSVRTYDNRLVLIPNADVFTSAVVNNTESSRRRQEFDVGIDYGCDTAGAQLIAFEVIRETEGVLSTPAPDVLVAELAPRYVVLRCRFYTDPLWRNVLAVGSEARRRVKEALLREGMVLSNAASDVHDVRLDAGVGEALRRAAQGPSGEPAAAEGESAEGAPAPSPLATPEESASAERDAEAKASAALPRERTGEYG